MKRNGNKVPGFDEIIFSNRNRMYGAYDLRRRYKSAAIISLLGGITLSSIPFILMFVLAPVPVKGRIEPGTFVVVQTENLIDPGKIVQPEPQKPAPAPESYTYIQPKVVDDTMDVTNLMINDFIGDSVVNKAVIDNTGNIDSIAYTNPVTEVPEETEPLILVEEQPEFPGGYQALLKFIADNTKYPPEALENLIQGKVFIKFAVWSDGSVRRLEVTRRVHPSLDEEALRVVSSLPRWKPGRQNGKPVPVWFSVPVTFEIKTY
jgi:periplasmic protein TonB